MKNTVFQFIFPNTAHDPLAISNSSVLFQAPSALTSQSYDDDDRDGEAVRDT